MIYDSFTTPSTLQSQCFINQGATEEEDEYYCGCNQDIDTLPNPCSTLGTDGNPTDPLCPFTQMAPLNDLSTGKGTYVELPTLRASTCKGCVALLIDQSISFTGNYLCQYIEDDDNYKCHYETAGAPNLATALAVGTKVADYRGFAINAAVTLSSKTNAVCSKRLWAGAEYLTGCQHLCNVAGITKNKGLNLPGTDASQTSASCIN